MRNAFIRELVSQARLNPKIALIVGDLGYSVVEPFAEEFPDRFINAGVAEQNMTGLAAGMASEGYHVFTYSIANFPTFRCAEQIRNDVAYHNLPVTIVSVGGGLAYGSLGYSHHAVQDYSVMRVMPNMLIAAPGDPMDVRACMRYLVENPRPSYLRLGKAGEPEIHQNTPSIEPGKWVEVIRGMNSRALLCTGATLSLAFNWVMKTEEYAGYSLYSLPLWGMEHKSQQVIRVSEWDRVVTLEDHLKDGGFGSWLLEALSDQPKLCERITIKALDPVVCGMVGMQQTLNCAGGLI